MVRASLQPVSVWCRGICANVTALTEVVMMQNAGLRGRVTTSREGLHKGGPYKALTTGKRATGGRNSTGTYGTCFDLLPQSKTCNDNQRRRTDADPPLSVDNLCALLLCDAT